MNSATAFGTVFTDELARCGLREVVLAPGSRSTRSDCADRAWAMVSALASSAFSCDTRSAEPGPLDSGNAEYAGQEAMVIFNDMSKLPLFSKLKP